MTGGLRNVFATLLMAAIATPLSASDAVDRAWQFRVLLDGKPIGTHSFELQDEGQRRILQSEANFEVKFLFFTAYRYEHRNVEQWSENCLREIDARTVTNGREQEVVGEQQGDAFIVEKPQQAEGTLPACVMTFAYWNPDFLGQARLLNPQTGEFLDVTVEEMGSDNIRVRGENRAARRYRVTAKNTDLEVWYSEDREWLALESVAKGGRKIRYELI